MARVLILAALLVLLAFPVLQSLRERSEPTRPEGPPRMVLGVAGRMGYFVEQVVAESPAHRAGLRVGDVIVRVNETLIEDRSGFQQALAGLPPGTPVTVHLLRPELSPEAWHPATVTLGSTPGGEPAPP